VPLALSQMLFAAPPLQLLAVVHESHISDVPLQWFEPQISRTEFWHDGRHTPVDPVVSGLHAYPDRHEPRPAPVQFSRHCACGIVSVPRFTHVEVDGHMAVVSQLSSVQYPPGNAVLGMKQSASMLVPQSVGAMHVAPMGCVPVDIVMHMPAAHVAVGAHALLHAPQLRASVMRFTQLEPHIVWPAPHIIIIAPMHAPAVQVCPALHATPHVPQLAGSDCVSVHIPLH
jgi:hypothetical protein